MGNPFLIPLLLFMKPPFIGHPKMELFLLIILNQKLVVSFQVLFFPPLKFSLFYMHF